MSSHAQDCSLLVEIGTNGEQWVVGSGETLLLYKDKARFWGSFSKINVLLRSSERDKDNWVMSEELLGVTTESVAGLAWV